MDKAFSFKTNSRYYSIGGGEIRINARTLDYILVDQEKYDTKIYKIEVVPITTRNGVDWVERAFIRGKYYLASSKVFERKEQVC